MLTCIAFHQMLDKTTATTYLQLNDYNMWANTPQLATAKINTPVTMVTNLTHHFIDILPPLLPSDNSFVIAIIHFVGGRCCSVVISVGISIRFLSLLLCPAHVRGCCKHITYEHCRCHYSQHSYQDPWNLDFRYRWWQIPTRLHSRPC